MIIDAVCCERRVAGPLHFDDIRGVQGSTPTFMATVVDDSHLPTPSWSAMDSFLSHLAASLAVYDLGPRPSFPVPRYDGPLDLRTDTILRILSNIAHRMWTAEEVLEKYKLGLHEPVKHFSCASITIRSGSC